MAEAQQTSPQPQKLRVTDQGKADIGSVADLLEWFLNYDERVSRMRHPYADELFKWKQEDDEANGVGTYPFENAEARFAIGVIQAVESNDSEPLLKMWITDVLEALGRARDAKAELTQAYDLDADMEAFALAKAEKLTTALERRMYLSSCWLELLCTAEARILGWVYQDVYGKPYEP